MIFFFSLESFKCFEIFAEEIKLLGVDDCPYSGFFLRTEKSFSYCELIHIIFLKC